MPSWNGSLKHLLSEADAWFAERRKGRSNCHGLGLGKMGVKSEIRLPPLAGFLCFLWEGLSLPALPSVRFSTAIAFSLLCPHVFT